MSQCPSCGHNGSHSEFCPGFEENDPAVRVARVRAAAALAEARTALEERRQERDDAHTEVGDLTAALGAATARAERAEAAIQRARELLRAWSVEIGWQQAQYGDGSDKVGVGRLIGRQDAYRDLLAALDSTDPVEAALEGPLIVRFDEPELVALGMLLDLVHYDDLAAMWREMLPDNLLAALAQRPEERSDEGRITVADLADLVDRVHRRSDAGLPADGEERK